MKTQLLLLQVFLFFIIVLPYTTAVVDVGIEAVTISDANPSPGKSFELSVKIKNYGDEAANGKIIIYFDNLEKDSLGTFSINSNEEFSHKFTLSHGFCGNLDVTVKLFMNDNTLNHDWEVTIPARIGNKFHIELEPEKPIINEKIQFKIKNEYGNCVDGAEVAIGNTNGVKYKSDTTGSDGIFTYTPEKTGDFVLSITKNSENYCEFKQTIQVKHKINVKGPYSSRYPQDPIAGDEIVVSVYDEKNKPIQGVTVIVKKTGTENLYLTTGDSGVAFFVANTPGKYYIELERTIPPYWSVNKTLTVRSKPLILISISPEKPLLEEDVTIKILNENLSDVNITIISPNGFSRTILTDQNNKIKFTVDRAGTYLVNAGKKDYEDLNETFRVYNLLKILIEEQDATLGSDITITVIDHNNHPVSDANLRIKSEEGDQFTRKTDYNGKVTFKLTNKEYELVAEKKDSINATAKITSRVKKLLLNLSSKKQVINEGSIYIRVIEEETGNLVPAKITINGEKTGFRLQEIAPVLNFTPSVADNYEVYASLEYYESAKDNFVIERGLMEYECSPGCECMSGKKADRMGYELCGGSIKECNAAGNIENTENTETYCFEEPKSKECGNNTLAITRRITPKILTSVNYITVYLIIKPEGLINGLIITEKIPDGLEPVWDYSAVGFDKENNDNNFEEKIKDMPFTDANELNNPVNVNWISKNPNSWNPETREVKWWILNDNESINEHVIKYKLKLSNISKKDYYFDGNWELPGGETCLTMGDNNVILKLNENSLKCRINNSEIKQHIRQWNNEELTDAEILRLIHVCGEIIDVNSAKSDQRRSDAVTVARNIQEAANQSSNVTVQLDIFVKFEEVHGIIIKEKIPPGWNISYISYEGSFDEDKNEIKWVIYRGSKESKEKVDAKQLSYIIVSPFEIGNYTFSGTAATLEDGINDVVGNGKVQVKEKPGRNVMKFIAGIIIGIIVILLIIILIRRKQIHGRYY